MVEQAIIVAEMHETGHFVSSGRFQFIASDMVCGRNAICVNTPEPKCPCPPGYEITEPGNWNKGCKPLFNVTLFQSQQVKFVELPHVDHRGFDLNYTESISIDSCMKSCVGDYRSTVETSQLAILNGTDPICQSDELETMIGSPSMYNTNTKRIRWKAWCASFGGRWISCVSNRFRRFTYAELKKATNNFKEELGRGGSGTVYMGILTDERVVAVKILENMYRGEDVFWAEVSTIGKINHMNLVRMWGFCSEGKHRLLVYEHMENQSLDKHLFSPKFLEWKDRFEVALGTAKGLAYLHQERLEWIIHCDVKPGNILLDSEFEPKIADFGLAKLSQRGSNSSDFSRIRGTKGYMAPECRYHNSKHHNTKHM
ncbi:receptor protein kinase ZmPK1 [Populus alba x Populus x berolinensis]|uniref:non-specific serine/threonine protein kinase n=1 Tax=Populus alba x Populus x berolinensis TaxID=444605 RepID=A0AAD6VZ93_9ROSI|nr:receptor protein kinase ZmPK1 [Populus alba x Populus x berolinensis]